jgi:FolB domain-containing protein
MESKHSDWILLTKIGFPCIVGMNEDEQRTPQALEVELGIGLDLDAALGGELAHSVHYVAALDQVQFIAEEGRWRLLESLAGAIARHLLREPATGEGRAAIERVRVRVGKPGYLAGRAQPYVEIAREKSWFGVEPSAPPRRAARVHPLQLTRQSGAYHIDLAPGAEFSLPDGVCAFVLAGRLERDNGRELTRGGTLRGGESATNAADAEARLLAVGRPLLAVG